MVALRKYIYLNSDNPQYNTVVYMFFYKKNVNVRLDLKFFTMDLGELKEEDLESNSSNDFKRVEVLITLL